MEKSPDNLEKKEEVAPGKSKTHSQLILALVATEVWMTENEAHTTKTNNRNRLRKQLSEEQGTR